MRVTRLTRAGKQTYECDQLYHDKISSWGPGQTWVCDNGDRLAKTNTHSYTARPEQANALELTTENDEVYECNEVKNIGARRVVCNRTESSTSFSNSDVKEVNEY